VSRDKVVNAYTPIAWYTAPNGLVAGIRGRSNYQGYADRDELGVVVNRDAPGHGSQSGLTPRLQAWWVHDNLTVPGTGRPLIGLRMAGWTFDGAVGGELSYRWDASPYIYSRTISTTRSIGITYTAPRGFGYLPDRWDPSRVVELQLSQSNKFWRLPWKPLLSASIGIGGVKMPDRPDTSSRPVISTWGDEGGYARWEASLSGVRASGADSARILSLRAYAAGATSLTPLQRRTFVSALDPYQTLYNHFIRPTGGILTRDHIRTVPLGGAGLRGFDPGLWAGNGIVSLNAEQGARLVGITRGQRPLGIWGTVFADVGTMRATLGDAGAGVMLRGWLFDRDVRVRVDLPIWVSDRPREAGDDPRSYALGNNIRFDRVQLTLGSFW
jgi:hypothetical protein